MRQVAHLAMEANRRKVQEWQASGDGSRLYRLIFKACMMYGHKEKAEQVGYRVEDLYFYSRRLLRDMIPAVLEAWSGHDGFEYEYPDRTTWLDVSDALSSLSESEYQIIWWAFKGDPEEEKGYDNVGRHLGISSGAARQRVLRILRRMQEHLGGENPYPRRRVKSSAAALAEIRNVWNGEG